MGRGERSSVDGDLSLDACLELLANHQRRTIIRYFVEEGADHAPVDEMISAISDHEARETGERPGHDSIASTLFHVHLPKLADAGIIDYDTRHLEVRYEGDPRIEELYTAIREFE